MAIDREEMWRQPIIVTPLKQAFPELGEVKEFRSKRLIFNHNRTRVFGVVSSRYVPVEHGPLVDTVHQLMEKTYGKTTVNVRTLDGGGRIVANLIPDELDPVNVRVPGKGDDFIKLHLRLTNSYDGLSKFRGTVGAFRQICSNGMVVGQKFGSISGKHFLSLAKLLESGDALMELFNRGKRLSDTWRRWASETFTFEEAVELLGENFPKKYTKSFLAAEFFPMTKWVLYNHLTYFATHLTPSVARRVEFDEVISKLFYTTEEAALAEMAEDDEPELIEA